MLLPKKQTIENQYHFKLTRELRLQSNLLKSESGQNPLGERWELWLFSLVEHREKEKGIINEGKKKS